MLSAERKHTMFLVSTYEVTTGSCSTDRFTVVDENRNLRVNRIRLEKQTWSCSLTKQNLVSIYCNEGFGLGIKQDRYATTVLGFKISMSTMVAPTAMPKMAHPEGK